MNTGNSFSRLMLGTAQFGMKYGIANTAGKPDKATVKAILSFACDHGVDALDTAPEYGDSEAVIGRALRELGLREKFHIVTKVPKIPVAIDPARFIRDSVTRSLQSLDVPVLDGVLLHSEEDFIHYDALKALEKTGLIRHAGISLNTAAYREKCRSIPFLQLPCSLLDHRFDSLFTPDSGCRFIRSAFLQGMLLMPHSGIFIPEVLERREKLEALGIPMAELAIRYLLTLPGNNHILTGVETIKQLKENLRLSLMPPLAPELMEKIAAITSKPPLPELLVSPFFWTQYKKLHNLK